MNYKQALDLVRDYDAVDSTKCSIYAKVAEREGKPDAARFFRVLSYAKLVHARQCMTMNRDLSNTEQNLLMFAAAEAASRKKLMDQIIDEAGSAEDGEKRDLLQLFAEVQALYINYAEKAARDYSSLKKDYSVCDYCGLIVTGIPPQICPVCQADNAFVKIN